MIKVDELTGIIEEWLQDNGVDCRECKHKDRIHYSEPCGNCINNIGVILNFEGGK